MKRWRKDFDSGVGLATRDVLRKRQSVRMRKFLEAGVLAMAFGVGGMGVAHAQFAATNCSNIQQASLNALNNQKQSVDAVNNWLGQAQKAANACLTNMEKILTGGFAVPNISSLLNSALNTMLNAACQVATAPVTELANQRYTLPGGYGSIGLNGVQATIPPVQVPGVGSVPLLSTTSSTAQSSGFWNSVSNFLSF